MKIPLLNQAIKISQSNTEHKKKWLISCVAKRADGAVVSSTCHSCDGRMPQHHAEARVLRKAGHGATLYVARVRKGDRDYVVKARPCVHCQQLIKHYKVKEVYYTIANDEFGVWKPQENYEVIKKIC